ncbi:hypothetical protein D3C77_401880 [compost metagenome]
MLRQEGTVARKFEMLPQMQGQPSKPQWPIRRRQPDVLWSRVSPDIRIMMGASSPAAIHDLCRMAAICLYTLDQFKQRLVQLG